MPNPYFLQLFKKKPTFVYQGQLFLILSYSAIRKLLCTFPASLCHFIAHGNEIPDFLRSHTVIQQNTDPLFLIHMVCRCIACLHSVQRSLHNFTVWMIIMFVRISVGSLIFHFFGKSRCSQNWLSMSSRDFLY